MIESVSYSEKQKTTQYRMTPLGVKTYNKIVNTVKHKLNLT